VFSDYQCPGCAQAEALSEKLWKERKKVLRLCHKHLPLRNIHPHAQMAAQAAVAAQMQGKGHRYHQMLFANQSDLTLTALRGYAKSAGLDLKRFDADLVAQTTVNQVNGDMKDAERLKLTGTPTYLVNGREMTDPLNYTGLLEWVDEAAAAATP
jgi:protein-disulfide isomerase